MIRKIAIFLCILCAVLLASCDYNDASYYLYDENDDGTLTVMGITETYSKHIEIPETIHGKAVSAIGDDAFYNNQYIREVTLPDTVKTIGERAFADSENLNKVSIGKNCVTIGTEAFEGCIGLEEITLSEKLEVIGDEAFKGCLYLAEIEPPASLSSIGIDAFDNCEQLVIISQNGSFANEYAIEHGFPTDFSSTDRYTFVKIVLFSALLLGVILSVSYLVKKRARNNDTPLQKK